MKKDYINPEAEKVNFQTEEELMLSTDVESDTFGNNFEIVPIS